MLKAKSRLIFRAHVGARGSASIMMLLALSVCIVITVAAYSGTLAQQIFYSRFPKVHAVFQLTKDMIKALVDDERAWKATIYGNWAFLGPMNPYLSACLNPAGQCTLNPNFQYPMVINDGYATQFQWIVPDRLPAFGSATSGFTEQGLPCGTFNLVNGNDSCPISWRVTFSPMCQPGPAPCINPRIVMQFTALYVPRGTNARKLSLNLVEHNFTLVR